MQDRVATIIQNEQLKEIEIIKAAEEAGLDVEYDEFGIYRIGNDDSDSDGGVIIKEEDGNDEDRPISLD